MSKYIFLDNWVYSRLTDAKFERCLSAFLKHQGYIILITSFSLVELYNPNWENAGDKDRVAGATDLWSKHPFILVDQAKVYERELEVYPNPVSVFPIELNLNDIPEGERALMLLKFLRNDELFINQGESIKTWVENYNKIKGDWFNNVDNIIEHACRVGDLKRDSKGNFVELQQCKEKFLLSLDFRMANPNDIDSFLQRLIIRANKGEQAHLTAIRLSSLCFWYAYIDIDQTNKMKHEDSDIGDFYQISLLPYCSAFTTDGSMYQMLKRIHEPIAPVNCDVITPKKLGNHLSKYQ